MEPHDAPRQPGQCRGLGFDLTDFLESPQVARYGAEGEGHFDWHSDIGAGQVAAKRKLTIVVQFVGARGL